MTTFSDYFFDEPDVKKLLGAFFTLGLTVSLLKQIGRKIEEWGMAKLPELPERIQRYLIRVRQIPSISDSTPEKRHRLGSESSDWLRPDLYFLKSPYMVTFDYLGANA